MIVRLIAHTTIPDDAAMFAAGWVPAPLEPTRDGLGRAVKWIDQLAEFAGRLCYQSWHRPNPATATNEEYLRHIIESQHFSVLEHASASFYVAEVSRSLLAEITRHRHLSFSVLSQRYVDESLAEAIVPPALADQPALAVQVRQNMEHLSEVYVGLVDALRAQGLTRKQAREAARSVLPNATETKFIVTGNMRAWRDVIAKRIHPAADAEIRGLAQEILRQLKTIAPHTFSDMSA